MCCSGSSLVEFADFPNSAWAMSVLIASDEPSLAQGSVVGLAHEGKNTTQLSKGSNGQSPLPLTSTYAVEAACVRTQQSKLEAFYDSQTSAGDRQPLR